MPATGTVKVTVEPDVVAMRRVERTLVKIRWEMEAIKQLADETGLDPKVILERQHDGS